MFKVNNKDARTTSMIIVDCLLGWVAMLNKTVIFYQYQSLTSTAISQNSIINTIYFSSVSKNIQFQIFRFFQNVQLFSINPIKYPFMKIARL